MKHGAMPYKAHALGCPDFGTHSMTARVVHIQCSVRGQVDDADAVESVQDELNSERGQKDSEDLFGYEHAALIEMVADSVRPTEHGDV